MVPARLSPGLGAGPSDTRGAAPSLPRVSEDGAPFAAALSASPGAKMPVGGGPPGLADALARAAATEPMALARSGSSTATWLVLLVPASLLSPSESRCFSFLSQPEVSAPARATADRTRAVRIVGFFMSSRGFTSGRAGLEARELRTAAAQPRARRFHSQVRLRHPKFQHPAAFLRLLARRLDRRPERPLRRPHRASTSPSAPCRRGTLPRGRRSAPDRARDPSPDPRLR